MTMKKRTARRPVGLTARRDRVGYLFVLPIILGIFCLFIPMFVQSIWYSFCNLQYEVNSTKATFIGWENYYNAFMVDTEFRSRLLSTVGSMLVDMVIILLFSFFIANILNQKFAGRSFARAVFFLPVILATGIIASSQGEIMGGYYNGSYAMQSFGANSGADVMSAFGSSGGSFFDLEELLLGANISSGLATIIVDAVNNTTDIVNSSGVQILIFISALQSIPQSVFEAAKVEGASKWEEFWKITFPMMTPTIYMAMIYTIIDAFVRPSYGMMYYIEQQGTFYGKEGYAAALAVIFMVIMLAIIGILTLITRKRIYYEN